jgi:hypothetical protein
MTRLSMHQEILRELVIADSAEELVEIPFLFQVYLLDLNFWISHCFNVRLDNQTGRSSLEHNFPCAIKPLLLHP